MPRIPDDSPVPDENKPDLTIFAREKTYTFRELSMAEYKKLLKLAEQPDPEKPGQSKVDDDLLLEMMIAKCSIEPKMTPAILEDLGMRLVRRIQAEVNWLHFGPEPDTDPSKKDEKKDEDEDKGEAAAES